MDKAYELSEQVRQYARAYIIKNGILPFEYPKNIIKQEGDDGVSGNLEFGVSDGKKIRKTVLANRRRKKRKKKEQTKEMSSAVRASLHAPKKYSKEEFKALRAQAKLALAKASKLAGEPVVYCCGLIRKESKHECNSAYRQSETFKEIRRLSK